MTVRSINKVVHRPIDQTEWAVREALAAQGFGVLTEIDVAATFEAKLGISIADPRALMDGPALAQLAEDAAARLTAALESLPDSE